MNTSPWRYVRVLFAQSLKAFDRANVMTTVVQFALAIVIALVLTGTVRSVVDATIGMTMAVFLIILFVVHLLFLGPYKLWAASVKEHNVLLERIKPRLRLSVAKNTPVHKLQYGATTVSPFTGVQQTQLRQSENFILIQCTNIGDFPLHDCEAFLVDVRDIENNEEHIGTRLLEPIRLNWSRNKNQPEFSVTIHPNLSRLIHLAVRHPEAVILFRNAAEIPVEHHQMFRLGRTYRLGIQVSGPHCVCARSDFCLRIGNTADDIHIEKVASAT
jgi:hypothetical protein